MQQFRFKTRYSSNDPKGKPRVYFTCHPGDFDTCFKKIADDILALQDCVVYYTEDMAAPIDEQDKETTLGYMNLFVVPITRKLLKEPNRARNEDIVYAVNAKIPVLPIMMEDNISPLYEKCDLLKDCQYLNPLSDDSSEKNYTDKLSVYLESVLVSDETANRIREAFDAYIFLSYRKKDRRYANELMKRIHEIPEFRNVAIWYDEFLTPGEDFRKNITQAMHSCSLFTLVVTPNILEDHNFVQETEYPMAMEAVMCVIPAEMEKTDREALAAKFRDIPECINPNDPARLTKQMLESLPFTQAVRLDEAEQNYLVGLAYLKGIDVEINRERGMELIIAAAEAGHPEAIEKLYNIYSGEEGLGFKNHRKALPWGEKLVVSKEKEYGQEHPNTLTAQAKLAATYSALREEEKAKTILETVYKIRCKVLGENHPTTVITLHNLAVEYAGLKDYQKALETNEKVYTLRCELLGETHSETLITLHNLAESYISLGKKETGVELLERACQQSKDALGATHPTTFNITRSLAQAYNNLMQCDKAGKVLEEAYAVYEEAFGEADSNACSLLSDLVYTYRTAGDDEASFRYMDRLLAVYAKAYGPKTSHIEFALQVFDDYGYALCAKDDFDKASLYWGKTYDCYYYYFGFQAEQTQSVFRSLVDLLPGVGAAAKAQLLERISQALLKMRDLVYFGSYEGTTKDGLQKMFKLLKTYRRYGEPEKRIELLEMFRALCAECCDADAPIFAKLEQMLQEDKALLD